MFTEMGVVLRNRLCVMGLMTVETRQMKRAATQSEIGQVLKSISWLLALRCRKYSKVFFTRNRNWECVTQALRRTAPVYIIFPLLSYHICIYVCVHCLLDFFHFLFEFNYPVDQSNEDACLFNLDYLKVNWFFM